MKKTFLLAALTIAMTACNRTEEPAPTPNPVNPGASSAPSSQTEEIAGKQQPTYLKLDQSVVDLCAHPDGLMATQVSWDASSLPTEGVEVWLQSPGEERKLWAATTPKSTDKTGEWLRNGSKVILINGADKAVLQEIVVTEKACLTKQ